MGKPLSELLPRNVVHNLSPENANLGQILNAIYIVEYFLNSTMFSTERHQPD